MTSAASAGCHRLLREFDARCITGADDVLELLGASQDGRGPDDHAERTDDRTRVLDALSARTRRDAGQTAKRAGMGIAHVQSLLGLLELEGAVEGDERGWRRTSAAMDPP